MFLMCEAMDNDKWPFMKPGYPGRVIDWELGTLLK